MDFALQHRVVVLEFPNQFLEGKQVPDIEKRWLEDPVERSGIVNWALEGLRRLFRNGKFTRSDAMKDVVDQYRKYSQPVKYFVEKYCEVGLNKWVTKEALYEAYVKAAEEEDLEVLDEKKFALEIRKTPRVQVAKKRINDRAVRIWKGIAIKSEAGEASEASDPYSRDMCETLENYRSIEVPASPAPVASLVSQDPVSHSDKDPHLTAFMDIFNSLPDGLSVNDFWKPFLAYAFREGLPESMVKAFIEYLEKDGKIFVDKLRGVVKKASGGNEA